MHRTKTVAHSAIEGDSGFGSYVAWQSPRFIGWFCAKQTTAAACPCQPPRGAAHASVTRAPAGILNGPERCPINQDSRGYDVTVACQLPKLDVRVRFPLPAPNSSANPRSPRSGSKPGPAGPVAPGSLGAVAGAVFERDGCSIAKPESPSTAECATVFVRCIDSYRRFRPGRSVAGRSGDSSVRIRVPVRADIQDVSDKGTESSWIQ